MIVDIKKSFEMPSQEEWDNLLATEHFESMRLDEALLKITRNASCFIRV